MVSQGCLERAKHAIVKPCNNPYNFTLRFCKENYFDLNVHMIVLLSANVTISKVRFHQEDLKVFFFNFANWIQYTKLINAKTHDDIMHFLTTSGYCFFYFLNLIILVLTVIHFFCYLLFQCQLSKCKGND